MARLVSANLSHQKTPKVDTKKRHHIISRLSRRHVILRSTPFTFLLGVISGVALATIAFQRFGTTAQQWLEVASFARRLTMEASSKEPSAFIGHILTICGGLGIIIFWGWSLYAYLRQKHWERVGFTLNRIKEFEEDDSSALARSLIDTNAWATKIDASDRIYYITDAQVIKALEPYRPSMDGFTVGEIAVRKSFDAFLENMERFTHLIETGLISSQDLYPYIHYWLDVIGGARSRHLHAGHSDTCTNSNSKSWEWKVAFFLFSDTFGYAGFRKLMATYDYNGIPAFRIEQRDNSEGNCCLVRPGTAESEWHSHLLINNADPAMRHGR